MQLKKRDLFRLGIKDDLLFISYKVNSSFEATKVFPEVKRANNSERSHFKNSLPVLYWNIPKEDLPQF